MEGITALICPAETKMGNTCVVTPPSVTLRETPPKVVDRGNAETVCGWAGPRFSPNTLKMLPCAMGALGSLPVPGMPRSRRPDCKEWAVAQREGQPR